MARCDFLLAFYSGLRSRWNYCQVIIRLNKQNRNPRQQNKEKQEEHSGIYATRLISVRGTAKLVDIAVVRQIAVVMAIRRRCPHL